MAKPSDLDLMMLADGELSAEEARRVRAAVEGDPELRTKLAAIGQIGETVRTYLELETDQAEAAVPEFSDMWATIERRIAAGDASELPASAVPATIRTVARPAEPTGAWAAVRGWFETHRGHVMSGLVSAGAVAGLMVWLRPAERMVERQATPPAPIGVSHVVSPPPCEPGPGAAAPRALPEVESFEVFEGSGTVFTLPGDADDDSGATVIWIEMDRDQDTVEGPI